MQMWPQEAVNSVNDIWSPDAELVSKEIAALKGSVGSQLMWRIPETFKMQTFIFLIWLGWRAFAMMLIGMSLYQFGLLQGIWSKNRYLMLAGGSLAIALMLARSSGENSGPEQ